jgi:cation transport regulator ChaC
MDAYTFPTVTRKLSVSLCVFVHFSANVVQNQGKPSGTNTAACIELYSSEIGSEEGNLTNLLTHISATAKHNNEGRRTAVGVSGVVQQW